MTAAHWSEGYATGAAYSHHDLDDLNPLRAAFTLLLEGLGDQRLEEFFARSDLPQFAFVGLHGVWSPISAANHARIADFLRRHLLPGGVVDLSHNTLAGWAAMMPLRDLMLQHLHSASPPGRPGTVRTKEALAFMQRLLALRPALLTETPELAARFAELEAKSPAYLLHELLNEDWHPMPFAQLHAELRPEGRQMMKGQQRVTECTAAIAMLQPLVGQMQERWPPLLRRLGVVD